MILKTCNKHLLLHRTCLKQHWTLHVELEDLKLVKEFSVHTFVVLGQTAKSFYSLKISMTRYSKDLMDKMCFPRHYVAMLLHHSRLCLCAVLNSSPARSHVNVFMKPALAFPNRDRCVYTLKFSSVLSNRVLAPVRLAASFFCPVSLWPSMSLLKSSVIHLDLWHWVICFSSLLPAYPGWNPCDSD